MILDLERFVAARRARWRELEELLDALQAHRLPSDVDSVARVVQLYEFAASDLARLSTFAAAPSVQQRLEALVARAYAEIHDPRDDAERFSPWQTLSVDFPRALRRRWRALCLACAVTGLGALFGAGALWFDPGSKPVLMPFEHLLGSPSERVAEEESRAADDDSSGGGRTTFSAQLMRHNIRVSILCLAVGIAWGLGTIVLLFYNGAILGAVCLDYLRAGEGVFLGAWLLPHGSIEIPAILFAGTAGLVLGRALFADASGASMRRRLERIGPDLVAILCGTAAMLVWAGLIEAFLSQLHEPTVPYVAKIAFGLVELLALALFVARGGRRIEGAAER